MFCLKIDSATRHGRSVLGINVQFIDKNNSIQIRTLGMVQLIERHTSQYLKTEIEKLLKDYDCKLIQVLCCTIDNGANMVKCVNLLQVAQETDNETEVNDAAIDVENSMQGVGILICVRCASHTLQLAVNDVLKVEKTATYIKSIREKIKKAKSTTYKQIFELSKINIPPLDIVTRWNSTFLMIKSISDNKEFYKKLDNGKFID